MTLDLEIREAHGLSNGGKDPRVGLQELGTGHIAIETDGLGPVAITAAEARYLAARLIRLAWRADRRKVSNQ